MSTKSICYRNTLDSKSSDRKIVWVRAPPPAISSKTFVYERKVTGCPSGPNGSGQSPVQFERCPDFSRWICRVILDHVDGGNYVSLTVKVSRESGTEEVLGTGPAAPGASAGIVRD
jgi:hypothetical protein